MTLSLYRDTSQRGRWSDPRARLNEMRILFARSERRFYERMGWPLEALMLSRQSRRDSGE